MHRTKCTEMINGVLAPYFLKKLVADVGDQRFSLLLDESTDISVSKYLGVVIRYFSDTKQTIVSTFLGLVELEGGDARSIARAVVAFLEKCGLKKEKLLGIGTDNASVMTGINNGVHKFLKEEYGLKDLILIRCVCHSLQLAVSHASNDTIPRSVEYLVRETYNWFSVSPKRREAYKAIYETINCGEKPLQITKVCATRWLSIEPAVSRILDQWEELRLHFSVTKSSEHCYMAEVLYSMYSDPQNILYLTFLKSVLGEVQLAIKAFEGEQVDPLKLLDSLVSLIKSVSSRVLNPLANIDVLKGPIDGYISPKPYLGYLFESKAAELHLLPEDEKNVRKRCVAFTISLTNELRVRLPDNIEALQYITVHQKRSEPEPSCVSIKSDQSLDCPVKFKSDTSIDDPQNFSTVHQKRSEPEPSCVSIKSDESLDCPVKLKSDDTRLNHELILPPSVVVQKPTCKKYDQSMNQPQDSTYPGVSHEFLNRFKSNLMKKFFCLNEGTAKQGNPTLLNEIYTELYITESESGEIINEHEVRQIETQSRRAATEDTPIKCNDIFRPLPGQDKHIRTVLTKGVAGIGKTVSVQKFILDWAEGKENQDVHLIFPLPFREINLMKDKTLSLSDLLQFFFPETKDMEMSSDKSKVLFIFDGLDECRYSLDFQSNVRLCNISASVDVLLMNLIVGNLLPSALIWITSRPAAADLIPSECVHQVTEVRGFNEPQKEEYFRKRISDQSLANRIITHLKSSRSLYIMCHIPVFCWISATVLEKMLSEEEIEEIPKTLTQMDTYFLIIQTNIKHEKDYEKNVTDEDMILKLGELAFQQLVKGNLIFYEEDLRECGIDVTEASVYSGLCSQIFREEFGLYQGKVFCFVHLSIQEHLAALYAHLSCTSNNINVFDQITKQSSLCVAKSCFQLTIKNVSLSKLHWRAVNEALQSKNGHLDLFLRFLLGLSVKTHQVHLQRLIKWSRSSNEKTDSNEETDCSEKTVKHIKKKIRTTNSPEKTINLFYCLNELGDHSLVQEIQQYLESGTISEAKLSSSQWSALVFVLLTSEDELNEFRLDKFVKGKNTHENMKVLQKLLPVIIESRSGQLNNCGITDETCAALASALRSNPSHLRNLNMSENKLGKSVTLLFAVLEDPHCKLEILWLMNCGITDEGFSVLASALRSNPSHLRELKVSGNELGDSSMNYLSDLKDDPNYKLETLS
ncbi:protein NLRC3-like [Carassius auratus]|uniref:Protein NLRC3-like n=1 Tax=Carassius auratus TaxID=7957 RepID=A0A6P6PEI8_CARAU|nr:protein NLRC3-like [Carassius auratus]